MSLDAYEEFFYKEALLPSTLQLIQEQLFFIRCHPEIPLCFLETPLLDNLSSKSIEFTVKKLYDLDILVALPSLLSTIQVIYKPYFDGDSDLPSSFNFDHFKFIFSYIENLLRRNLVETLNTRIILSNILHTPFSIIIEGLSVKRDVKKMRFIHYFCENNDIKKSFALSKSFFQLIFDCYIPQNFEAPIPFIHLLSIITFFYEAVDRSPIFRLQHAKETYQFLDKFFCVHQQALKEGVRTDNLEDFEKYLRLFWVTILSISDNFCWEVSTKELKAEITRQEANHQINQVQKLVEHTLKKFLVHLKELLESPPEGYREEHQEVIMKTIEDALSTVENNHITPPDFRSQIFS